MEEQNKDLQETVEVVEEAEIVETEEEVVEEKPKKKRNNIIWVFGGFYLCYTGYNLCKGVLDGAEGSSWGFFAAGVAFILIGAGLIFVSAKESMKESKAQKMVEAAAAAKKEEFEQANPGAGRKMSIAERANLASRLADDEDVESETTAEETEE